MFSFVFHRVFSAACSSFHAFPAVFLKPVSMSFVAFFASLLFLWSCSVFRSVHFDPNPLLLPHVER